MIRHHDEVYSFARYAGLVERYHTWPVHRRATVAEHTWQMLRIYESIWENIPPEVTSAILWHDAGELWVGDFPFPLKAEHPDLSRTLDKIEEQSIRKLNSKAMLVSQLSLREQRRVKMCDMIDNFEFALVEMNMGNHYCEPVVRLAGEVMDDRATYMGKEDQELVAAYVAKVREKFKCTLSSLGM